MEDQIPGYNYIMIENGGGNNCSGNNSNSNSNNNHNNVTANGDNDENTYALTDKGIVLIQHAFGRHLRVTPNNESQANAQGGRGQFARWVLELHGDKLKFRSNKSGRYLRIIQKGNKVDVGGGGGRFTFFRYNSVYGTLESVQFPGTYLSVQKNNLKSVFAVKQLQLNQNAVDSSSKFTIIPLPNANPNNNNNNIKTGPFSYPYTFGSPNSMVIVAHAHGAFLRIDPNQRTAANANGGHGQFAQWSVHLFSNGRQLKLQNNKSGKYLRIVADGNNSNNRYKVNVGGGGGKFTLFNIHLQGQSRNTVKLESVVYPGIYVACGRNRVIRSGTGGPHCPLTFFVREKCNENNSNNSENDSDFKKIIAEQKILIEQQREFIVQQQTFIRQLQGRSEPGSEYQNVSDINSGYARLSGENNNHNHQNSATMQ